MVNHMNRNNIARVDEWDSKIYVKKKKKRREKYRKEANIMGTYRGLLLERKG